LQPTAIHYLGGGKSVTRGDIDQGQALDAILELVMDAEDLDDLCRGFVFNQWGEAVCWGAFIFSVGPNLDLTLEAGYGRKRSDVIALIEDPNFVSIDQILRERSHFVFTAQETSYVCVPLIRFGLPIGIIVFASRLGGELIGVEVALRHISRSVGFALAVLRLQNQRRSPNQARSLGGEALTQRQLAVLSGISKGLTNGQIASELVVSESTVRHETMRIYKFLAVGNRAEALAVARGSGYLL
jgi:DNA-binding CsgD family transcriptional regulator